MNKWQRQIAEFLKDRNEDLEGDLEQLTRDSQINPGDTIVEIDKSKDGSIYRRFYIYEISKERKCEAAFGGKDLSPKKYFTEAIWGHESQINGSIGVEFHIMDEVQPVRVYNRSRRGSAKRSGNSVLIGKQVLGSGRFFRYNTQEACTQDLAKTIVNYESSTK
jgi:hypothetical protein